MRTAMVGLALLVGSLAAAVALPENCLWVEEGRVQFRGALRMPEELRQARHVSSLTALGAGLVAWSTGRWDEQGEALEFSLNLADLQRGTNRRLLVTTDPFRLGKSWHLERVCLDEAGSGLLVKTLLPGSGLFTAVYRLPLTTGGRPQELPEDTPVWTDVARDGRVKVSPTWALADDAQEQPLWMSRYGSLIIAAEEHPQGRMLWKVARHREIPASARWEITGAVLSGDGQNVIYTNDEGVWTVPVSGGQPRQIMGAPKEASWRFESPVWTPEGVYFILVKYTDGPAIRQLVKIDGSGLGRYQVVREDTSLFCLARL